MKKAYFTPEIKTLQLERNLMDDDILSKGRILRLKILRSSGRANFSRTRMVAVSSAPPLGKNDRLTSEA